MFFPLEGKGCPALACYVTRGHVTAVEGGSVLCSVNTSQYVKIFTISLLKFLLEIINEVGSFYYFFSWRRPNVCRLVVLLFLRRRFCKFIVGIFYYLRKPYFVFMWVSVVFVLPLSRPVGVRGALCCHTVLGCVDPRIYSPCGYEVCVGLYWWCIMMSKMLCFLSISLVCFVLLSIYWVY
jgi:hypothetical protein